MTEIKETVYRKIIEHIFFAHYQEGQEEIFFERQEIPDTAAKLNTKIPKNLGDLVYTFRYRGIMPDSVLDKAPEGKSWIILPAGIARYCFALTTLGDIAPNRMLSETKIPDSTPGIVAKYALDDEQGLLAKVRYNRLIDIFTGVTCYSLQNHLRTTVPLMGQVETDELYIGVDQRGTHYVFPIQAKSFKEKLGVVQIYQDFGVCETKFPNLICVPIATQFLENDLIVLFAFEKTAKDVSIAMERHYRLVPHKDINPDDLEIYRRRIAEPLYNRYG